MSESQTLNGLQRVPCFKDDGTAINVDVRQLKIKDIEAFASALGDPYKLLQLYTGQTPQILDLLTPESQNKILEVGDLLNRDFLTDQFKKRVARLDWVAPGASLAIAKQQEALLSGQPTSQPSAG